MVTDCKNCPLQGIDIFQDLSAGELAYMQKFKHGELKIDAHTPFILEGSNSPQLYTALKGMGLRYKTMPNGRRQVVNFVLPGDFIGLQAGVMGEMKHSVEATTPMVLCVFDRSELWSLFKTQPSRAFDLTWATALEEQFLGEALASLGQMNATEKMSWGLARFFMRCASLDLVENDQCPFPYRQQDLADALGLSLVHTNKTLMKLRDHQVMSLRDGILTVHDLAALNKFSGLAMEPIARRPLI